RWIACRHGGFAGNQKCLFGLQLVYGGQHLGGMAVDLDPAPDAAHRTLAIDEESAALDADALLAVHVLFLEHAVGLAYGFVGVGNQVEREIVFGLEFFVLGERVPRDADNRGTGGAKIVILIAKGLAFLGAAGGIVARVKIQHQHLAGEIGQRQGLFAGGWGSEIGSLAIGFYSHDVPQDLIGSNRPSACSSSHKSMNASRSACGCWVRGTCRAICVLHMVAPVKLESYSCVLISTTRVFCAAKKSNSLLSRRGCCGAITSAE